MYKYREKVYYNDKSGVRFNVSCTFPASPPDLDDPEKLKVPRMQILNPGTENQEVIIGDKYGRLVHPVGSRNRSNVYRAIRAIRDYGLSNTWDYMVTFTLSQQCLDRITVTDPKTKEPIPLSRSNYDTVMRAISRHIANLRVKYGGVDIKYLLIPELHADQYNYHFHGLMSGIPPDVLTDHWDENLRSRGYLNWKDFERKFGRCSLGEIRNTEAAVFYCLKYINKDLAAHSLNDGTHLYYLSKGLNKPDISGEGSLEYVWYHETDKMKVSDFGTYYGRHLTLSEKTDLFCDMFITPCYFENPFESEDNKIKRK